MLCSPNPVTVDKEVTFHVLGAGVEAIQVSIYDLSAKCIYTSGIVPGRSVSWDLMSQQSTRVANGIYLYMVQVKVGGNWRTLGFDKLAILQ